MNRTQLIEQAIDYASTGEPVGICISCGAEQPAEPDARRYTCEDCGEAKVYGADEILLMLG